MCITQYSKIIQVAVNIGNNKVSDNLILKKFPHCILIQSTFYTSMQMAGYNGHGCAIKRPVSGE